MFDLNQLLSFFDGATIARSQAYIREIDPQDIQVDERGDSVVLYAEIAGSFTYSTEVHIYRNGASIETECSCPVAYECKHAAALLAAADRYKLLNVAGTGALEPTAKKWLAQLSLVARAYQSNGTESLVKPSPYIYVLQPQAAYSPRELNIVVQKVRRVKDGGIAAAKPWHDFHMAADDDKMSPVDKRLIQALYAQKRANTSVMSFGRQLVNGLAASVLQEMAHTQRLYWQGHEHAQGITWHEEPYGLDFTWQELVDEETAQLKATWTNEYGQLLDIDLDALYLIPSEPPVYFDRSHNCMGLLKTRYPQSMLVSLLQAPSIPLSMAAELESALDELPESVALPAPVALARVERYGQAKPVLLIQSVPFWWRDDVTQEPQGFAKIMFDYDGGTVAFSQSGETFKGWFDGVKVTQYRNRSAEREAVDALMAQVNELQGSALRNDEGFDILSAPFDFWLDVLTEPNYFAQLGWIVRHAPDSPLNIHRASAPTVALTEHNEAGNDWFSLGMHIEANGRRYNLSDLLASLIETQPKLLDAWQMADVSDETFLFASAPDGIKIALRVADVRPILAHLTDLFNHPVRDGELQLDRYDAMRLMNLQHTLGLAYSGSERLQRLIETFRNGHELQMAAPEGFEGTLRPYQEKGLAWLQFLRESEHGGVLADDMGLGKTAQALAHILLEKNHGRLDKPALIVAPTSLMHNWRSEAARFTPSLKVLVLQGTERNLHFDAIGAYDIVLTTYPLLPRDEMVLLRHEYHLVILDEAQNIKNPIAKATQIARKLRTRHRLCLTGTPMENHLGELWSLYHFLMPGFLGSQEAFNKRFRHPIERRGDVPAQKALAARARPFMLRRRKMEVATELPPKTTTVVQIDMGKQQQKLYEAVRATMQTRIQLQVSQKGFKRSHIEILDALLKLRQVCCHPLLLKMDSVKKDIESAKLNALLDMVSEMVEEGRRILIFSQFTTMLSLIENALALKNVTTIKLTGQTKKRAEVIDAFQNGEVPVFLISLKAGGVGLNLTAADTVIHYDPWWNPAAEEQASDRAWRIGQDKPVFVYKLIIAGSIEEKIIEMQKRKANLTNSVIADDSEQSVKFNEEELMNLLAPMV